MKDKIITENDAFKKNLTLEFCYVKMFGLRGFGNISLNEVSEYEWRNFLSEKKSDWGFAVSHELYYEAVQTAKDFLIS